MADMKVMGKDNRRREGTTITDIGRREGRGESSSCVQTKYLPKR